MKTNRNKFRNEIEQGLKELGYRKTILGPSVADTLFIKVADKHLYLTLGLTYSNFNAAEFTAAFYLSKVTTWAAVWDDIPRESYKRIGHFLNANERIELLGEEYNMDKVVDSWWDMSDSEAKTKFLKAVKITESRFLAQPNMMLNVMRSVVVNDLSKLSLLVIREVVNHDDAFNYKFIPEKIKLEIEEKWFKAAERVLSYEGSEANTNLVMRLAYDAFRQNEMNDPSC